MKTQDFYSATISTGTYNTKNYTSKSYKTLKGLRNALSKLGYHSEIYNGLQFTYFDKCYTVTLNY